MTSRMKLTLATTDEKTLKRLSELLVVSGVAVSVSLSPATTLLLATAVATPVATAVAVATKVATAVATATAVAEDSETGPLQPPTQIKAHSVVLAFSHQWLPESVSCVTSCGSSRFPRFVSAIFDIFSVAADVPQFFVTDS